MTISDERLEEWAAAPRLNYYAPDVQDAARELLALRARVRDLEETFERFVDGVNAWSTACDCDCDACAMLGGKRDDAEDYLAATRAPEPDPQDEEPAGTRRALDAMAGKTSETDVSVSASKEVEPLRSEAQVTRAGLTPAEAPKSRHSTSDSSGLAANHSGEGATASALDVKPVQPAAFSADAGIFPAPRKGASPPAEPDEHGIEGIVAEYVTELTNFPPPLSALDAMIAKLRTREAAAREAGRAWAVRMIADWIDSEPGHIFIHDLANGIRRGDWLTARRPGLGKEGR